MLLQQQPHSSVSTPCPVRGPNCRRYCADDRLAQRGRRCPLCLRDPFVFSHMARIIAAAAAARLPIMQLYGTITKAGGLISYGPGALDLWRRSADLIDKILRGRPTDIPVERPDQYDLVINLKTAKALGLTIPDKLIALTDDNRINGPVTSACGP